LIDEWDFPGTFDSGESLDVLAVLDIAQETFWEFVATIAKSLKVG
jgi:hypothetical protein